VQENKYWPIDTNRPMLLQLIPLCLFIRIGRQRATPRDVLGTSTDRRAVRRAETAWRREYADIAPPPNEATTALRALGAVRDGDRVASLLRWLDGRGAAYSPSAAVAALALAGETSAARARAASAPVDAVAAALAGADGSAPHLVTLHAFQRTGALDLHGLDASDATRACALLLDNRDILGNDEVLIITGRGKHSRGASAVKRDVHELLTRRGAAFVEENEGAVRLQRVRPVDLWLDARRGRNAASHGVVTVFLVDEAAEAAGDVVTLIARGADVIEDGRCVGRIVDAAAGAAEARADVEAVVRSGSYDLLVLDGAPSDLLDFALERAARCNGISGAELTVVQCISNQEQVAAALDAGATTLCVAGNADSATWATASSLEARPHGDDAEDEDFDNDITSDIDDMTLEELAELMDDAGGPSVEYMSLAEARDVAWQHMEANFSDVCEDEANAAADDADAEVDAEDEDDAEDDGGEDIEDMSLEELVVLSEEVDGPSVEDMSLDDARDALWRYIEATFSEADDHDHDEDEEDGEWTCPGCGARNIPGTTECARCVAPRE